MCWKLFVWLLALVGTAQARTTSLDVARGKRFMTSGDELPRLKVVNRTTHSHQIEYMDAYNDWNPAQEYVFPSSLVIPPSVLSTRGDGEEAQTLREYSEKAASRSDKLFDGEAIAREHAKLVHDINALIENHPGWSSLRDEDHITESRDAKEDVYMEDVRTRAYIAITTVAPRVPGVNIKILPSSTPSPTAKPAASVPPTNLPLIVLGGNAAKIIKPIRHPYRFVGAASTARPIRFPSMMSYGYPSNVQPTLWQRFVSIFPRLIRR